jgi:hypothetical protein
MKNRCVICLAGVLAAFFCLAGISQARVVQDTEYGFEITVPDNWRTNSFVDGTDRVWALVAPDRNATVRIRAFQAPSGLTMPLLITAFETHVLKDAQRLTLEPYTLNGIAGQMAGYKAKFDNIDVGIGCFYTIQKQKAYIVWSMIPVALFQARSAEADAILNTFTLSGFGPPARPRQDRPRHREHSDDRPFGPGAGFRYQALSVDDSHFEFLYPAHFRRFQQSEGQSQWADPNAPQDRRVVMVVQTMSRGMGNSLQSVHDQLARQVKNNSAARLQRSSRLSVNGIAAYELRFTLDQRNERKYFSYLVLDIQGPNVATVSFVGPESLHDEMQQHFEKLKDSVHQTKTSDVHAPPPAPDGDCRRIGEVYTDGTGDRRTKKRGGTYLTISKQDIAPGASIGIRVLSGNFSYVTVHARYEGGIWKTAYQGPLRDLPVSRHFQSYLQEARCTHLVVSVNGAHEVYDPAACRAEIALCGASAGRCQSVGEVYTDGTGDRRTKKRGGTYLTIPKENISPGASIGIRVLSGNFSYVTVHARYEGGIWKTAYQGPLRDLPVSRHFQSYLQEARCTHLVVSVNGAHEVYDPAACRAQVNLCP